jgi:hypothetical protein
MPMFEECPLFSTQKKLQHPEQTPKELNMLISSKRDKQLSKRPRPNKWSAKETVCYLREVEELFQVRFHTIIAP